MSSSIKSPVSFPFYCVHQASNSKFLNRAERLTESNKSIRQRLAELCGLFLSVRLLWSWFSHQLNINNPAYNPEALRSAGPQVVDSGP